MGSSTEAASVPPSLAASALACAEGCRQNDAVQDGLKASREAWDAATDGAERDRAGWLLAYFLHRRGDLPAQVALAETLVPRLRQRGGKEFAEYLRWVVLAGCELARFDVALPLAYEVLALSDADGRPAVRAVAMNVLAACFERMGDPWQGERLMRDALALAREAGTPYELFVTVNNLCAALIGAYYLLRGTGEADDDALAPLQRALPLAREGLTMLSSVTHAPARVLLPGNLGEILVHLGEHDEARQWLNDAMAEAVRQDLWPQQARIRCSQAELALREGRCSDAQALLEGLLVEPELVPSTALRAHHTGYLVAQRLGDAAAALHHLESYVRLERRRSVRQLRAQSEMFVTRVESDSLRERARRFEAAARLDPLTGLANRRELDGRLPGLLSTALHNGQPLALALLDLDTYKTVNDRFGHPVGDQVLVSAARLLHDSVRASDLVARLGGDEFVLVLPEATGARAFELCERIRTRIASHDWSAMAPGLAISVSIGVAATPPHETAPLVARADAALYRAKRAGRNRTEIG